MNTAEKVETQVELLIVPRLLEINFTGSYPDWRRIHPEGIDLIAFQLDLNHEPSLCVEYGFTSPFASVQFGPEVVTPENLTTAALKFTARRRLNPAVQDPQALVPDYWYSFEDGDIEGCITRIAKDLWIAENWWAFMTAREKDTKTAPSLIKKVERA